MNSVDPTLDTEGLDARLKDWVDSHGREAVESVLAAPEIFFNSKAFCERVQSVLRELVAAHEIPHNDQSVDGQYGDPYWRLSVEFPSKNRFDEVRELYRQALARVTA